MNKRQLVRGFLPVIAIILSGFFILKFGHLDYYFPEYFSKKDSDAGMNKSSGSAPYSIKKNNSTGVRKETQSKKELSIKITSAKEGYYGSDGVISQTTLEDPRVNVEIFGSIEGESKIEIYQAGKKELLDFLLYDKDHKQINGKINTENLRLVSTFNNEELINNFDGSVVIPDAEAGIWLIRVMVGEKSKEAFVVRSNFGAIVKNADNEMIFWAQKFKTKKRLEGARIEVYSFLDEVKKLDSAITDSEGVAKTKISEKADVAFMENDGELAVIPVNMSYIGMSDYGGFTPAKKSQTYFVFTDRPIYQPGDNVNFKAVIRNEKDVRFSIPTGEALVEVASNFWDEKKEKIFSKKFNISENGTISGNFTMPETIKTGIYYVRVEINGGEKEINNFDRYYSAGTASFSVEHYQKPEYDIAVSSDQNEVISNDELTFKISGNYFSGQPLNGKAVKYKVYSSRVYSYANYFSDYERYRKNSYNGYRGGSVVDEGEAILNEFGIAEVKLDKEVTAHRNKDGKNVGDIGYDRMFFIEAEYSDESGVPVYDGQNIFVQAGTFSIFRDGKYQYGHSVGDDVSLGLVLASSNNSKISDVELMGEVKIQTWNKIPIPGGDYFRYEKNESNPEPIFIKTNSDGKATLKFKASIAGSYDIKVSATDERGNRIEKNIHVWVSEKDGFYWGEGSNNTGIRIQSDKDKYEPNENVRLTISSDLPDRDVFLSFDRINLNRYEVVRLNGNSAEVNVKLADADVPNIFAAVSSFSDQNLDADNINLIISTKDKEIEVTFRADKERYYPGDEVSLELETKDGRGRAVQAETAVWLVDKAIYELAKNNATGIFNKFWHERHNSTSQNHSLMDISIDSMAEKGGGGDGGGRTIFKDTAFWKADVMTDKNGKAKINFKLPDNLTTWVVAGISANKNTQVGEGTSEIVVSKDVIVRPILPNILRVDDSIKLSSLVHNFTKDKLNFDINLKAEGMKIINPAIQKTEISPQGEKRFFWQMVPQTESKSTKMTFSALSGSEKKSDVITKEIPVKKFGFWGSATEVGNDEHKEFKLALSENAEIEKTTINFSIAPTLLGTLPEAMKYLIKYPYGCVEQTTSRFVPAVIAKQNQDIFQSSIENKKINEIINAGILRLSELQNEDGGWGWYGGNSDPFITAYVIEYLVEARKLGFIVDAERMRETEKFLESENNYTDKIKIDEKVAKVYALSILNKKNEKSKDKLENFDEMTSDILALAVMANIRNGYNNSEDNGLKKLIDMAKPEGEGLFWPTGADYYFGSDDASTALAVRAIMMSNQGKDVAVKGVRYLTMKRRSNYWSNTFATANTIRALVDFSKKVEKDNPKYTYSIMLDGAEIKSGKIMRYNQLEEISIPVSKLKSSGSVLTLKKIGDGGVYSTLTIKEFHTDKNSPSFSNGLEVERKYENMTNPGQYLHVGDTAKVVISVSGLQSERNYAVIEDELPAGLVPINYNLNNERSSKNKYNYYNAHSEITENGAIITTHRIGAGLNTYSYEARVISEGEFSIPPVRAELMYSPEINGRSESQKMIIDNSLENEASEIKEVVENRAPASNFPRELNSSNAPVNNQIPSKITRLKWYIENLLWRVQSAWRESGFVTKSIFFVVVWGVSFALVVYYFIQKVKRKDE